MICESRFDPFFEPVDTSSSSSVSKHKTGIVLRPVLTGVEVSPAIVMCDGMVARLVILTVSHDSLFEPVEVGNG